MAKMSPEQQGKEDAVNFDGSNAIQVNENSSPMR